MKLNQYIDHTLLKPDSTPDEIRKICKEAKEYEFFSVCVNGNYIPLIKEELKDSSVKACAVIGFPLGQMSTKAKVLESQDVVKNGADEVDMVINIGRLKAGEEDYVLDEIKKIKETIPQGILKVIIETCLLTKEEIQTACRLSVEAGADFVKTSTGFSSGGATVEDVRLMKETVGDRAKVKASGGIHSKEEALAMIEAGAERIGASSGITIVTG
ncbi:MAG: deoxyribose-phosphate aldolase [Tissierellia bacterium]|nr:deoxyribose-phosphate aldolase [Tissierellia bacterium]